MPTALRHRHALTLPFVALAAVALVGGLLNGVTARGRLVDDFTDEGVAGTITIGKRVADTRADGTFELGGVPRTSRLQIDAGGYLRAGAPPDGGTVRLSPNRVSFQVNVEGTSSAAQPARVPNAQIREGTRPLATTDPSGNASVTPYPGRDAKVLVCAKGFETKELTIRGVAMTVELRRDDAGDCPPLPTPSPAPSPSREGVVV